MQFMNKVLYAREGAKSIMDRTFEDFPWQIRVEVDGVEIEVPEVSPLGVNNLYFASAAQSVIIIIFSFELYDNGRQ